MMSLTNLIMYFWGYALEPIARILNMVPTKKVEKTPYEIWHGKVLNLSYLKFFKSNLISQEASRSTIDFDEIQRECARPFENTSERLIKHELRDHGEPTNSKAALSYRESKKWLDVINAEMQIMKDNDLPPDGRIVRSKWLFKKKTDIDDNVHTYKAHLVAKGYTQTYGLIMKKHSLLLHTLKLLGFL
ncbi:hypothetical protein Tco_0827314 [Tanacetum coccineum]